MPRRHFTRIHTKSYHGLSKTPLYRVWASMLNRCLNPKDTGWHKYGGRGITVCERWVLSFEDFLADVGEQPPGMSLDRIDNDKGYEPSNIRWATPAQQARNTRRNVYLTFEGETKTREDWAKTYGLKANVLRSRLKLGWSLEQALKTPVEYRTPRKTTSRG